MKKLIVLALILLTVGCASKKDVLYFQDIDDLNFELLDQLTTTTLVEPDDILRVRLTALDAESLIPFQFEKPGLVQQRTTFNNLEMLQLNGYLVDKDGAINFPELGRIHVSGLSVKQVEEKIYKELSQYIKDPTVSVRIINSKITVIGDVKKPGTFTLSEEKITLPQAIGLAGDLSIKGDRHNVLIIRNNGGKRISKRIDLTESDWMNSDFYYLKQNDIVYVEPNTASVKTAGLVGSPNVVLSAVSVLLSIAVLIFK